jgi:hypothetical protein
LRRRSTMSVKINHVEHDLYAERIFVGLDAAFPGIAVAPKTYREIARERIIETVYQSIGGSPWSPEFEDALQAFFAKFDAAVDGVSMVAEVLNKRVEGPGESTMMGWRQEVRA